MGRVSESTGFPDTNYRSFTITLSYREGFDLVGILRSETRYPDIHQTGYVKRLKSIEKRIRENLDYIDDEERQPKAGKK